MKMKFDGFDRFFAPLILLSAVVVVGFFFTTISGFQFLIREDSVLENLTAVFLFCASVVLFVRLLKGYQKKPWTWSLGLGFMALAFFFGAGEEISWGQRIFGIESSEYFQENNAQGETNLHNIKIGEVKLNKLIFSNLLSIAFGFYFLVFPFLYDRNRWFRKRVEQFGIVLPKVQQTLVFVLVTLMLLGGIIRPFLPQIPEGMEEIAIDNVKRKWEPWEFMFGITIFWIALSPKKSKHIETAE